MYARTRIFLVTAVLGGAGCAAGGAMPIDPSDDPDRDPPVDSPDVPSPTSCTSASGEDYDDDGFTKSDGDCNDCSAQVNPAAFDDPGNSIDEDCDGSAAERIEECDAALALDTRDPLEAARAIGLCRSADDGGWGVISAEWVEVDGDGRPSTPMQHGLMSRFGTFVPRAGGSMLAISSGAARAPDQPGYTEACDEYSYTPTGTWPAGFDPESASCPGVTSGEVFDSIALELTIQVPSNAHGFEFDSSFFTYEYPDFICSSYNDFFLAVMDPAPPDAPPDGNLVFDEDGNRVGVNTSLLRICEPGVHGGRTFECPLGTAPLAGTGYGAGSLCNDYFATGVGGGSTGWLHTTVPVEPGSTIILRFSTWDAGDATLDSTVLIDGFRWLVTDPGVIETDPILI